MTTLGRTHDRIPDWMVQSVFDPGGEGHDFAYTIGLHERGLPELHLWARPPLGDDPGDDWMFSPSDRTGILNETAWRLIEGEIGVGSRWEAAYDAGLVTARFQLDPPGDREELEAFGIAPGALVLPVRWSLHRRPVRPPRPLAERAAARATSEYAAILSGLGAAPPPPGWTLPSRFAPGGELGPLTPLAAARAAQFWAADATTLSNLAWAAITVDQSGSLTWPRTIAAATARGAGRVDEVARVERSAELLVDQRTGRPDWPRTWAEMHHLIGFQPDEASPDEAERSVVGYLRQVLAVVLATEVVADRLTATQRLEGRGAWLTGFGPVGELPGPQWRAPRRVVDHVLSLIRPLGRGQLLEIARRHVDQRASHPDADYVELADRLSGWAIIAPAGCPWRGGLDRLPHARWPPVGGLQEWATVMTSAVVHLERLTATDLAALTAPFLDLVPELPAALRAAASRDPPGSVSP